jgi:hypothetical protein
MARKSKKNRQTQKYIFSKYHEAWPPTGLAHWPDFEGKVHPVQTFGCMAEEIA